MDRHMVDKIRVLYSFPHKIGATGICYAAWEHVEAIRAAGADVTVFTGVLHKQFSKGIHVHTTLSRGKIRVPYRIFGRLGSCRIHDWVTSRWLHKNPNRYDIVHGFALGSLETIRAAVKLGIPTVLERCNAHTRYAYEVVQAECTRLEIKIPHGSSHEFNAAQLTREELEYDAADYLFCPSEFVAQTFVNYGINPSKIERFQYGFKSSRSTSSEECKESGGLTALFAAACTPRKGLHYALDAWLSSSACEWGRLLIAGEFIPGYAERLSDKLSHPSITLIGYRSDLSEVMRNCDVLILPSIEEGSALVTYDARAAGCLLLVSDASGAVCEHEENALVHPAGDAAVLAEHISRVDGDRTLLNRLTSRSIQSIDEISWEVAGISMVKAYERMVRQHKPLMDSHQRN